MRELRSPFREGEHGDMGPIAIIPSKESAKDAVVRHDAKERAAGRKDPGEFLHARGDVGNMLERVERRNNVKGRVWERHGGNIPFTERKVREQGAGLRNCMRRKINPRGPAGRLVRERKEKSEGAADVEMRVERTVPSFKLAEHPQVWNNPREF